jgi:hypothetical protein
MVENRQHFPTQLLADAGDGGLVKSGLHPLTKSPVGFSLAFERILWDFDGAGEVDEQYVAAVNADGVFEKGEGEDVVTDFCGEGGEGWCHVVTGPDLVVLICDVLGLRNAFGDVVGCSVVSDNDCFFGNDVVL